MLRKHKFKAEEIAELDALKQPMLTATIHAAVLTISRMKKGRSSHDFFEARLTDGVTTVRIVGFSAEHHKQLSKFKERKVATKIADCEVRSSRQGYKMEVILKRSSQILPSSKHFDISDDYNLDAPVITLDKLPTIVPYDDVTVDVKVIAVHQQTTVGKDKVKQDVIVTDKTASAKLTLWEEQIDSLVADNSYTLKNFTVREFNSVKYLQKSPEDSEVIPIPDLTDVAELTSELDSDTTYKIFNAQVIAVPQLDAYKSCNRCKARVEPLTPPLGRCSRLDCGIMQRFDMCPSQSTAKLMFMSGDDVHTLHVFGKHVAELANVNDKDGVTPEQLLQSAMCTSISYNKRKIVTAITRI